MVSNARLAPSVVVSGLVAGAVGAVTVDAYLLVVLVGVSHAVTVEGFYRFVASGALGKAAYTDPNAVWLGVGVHALVSLAWGVGYAYAAARAPQLDARPITSGIVFGIVVMIAMQLVEVAANIYTLPTTFALLNSFVAHTLFFGIPVAWVARLRSNAR